MIDLEQASADLVNAQPDDPSGLDRLRHRRRQRRRRHWATAASALIAICALSTVTVISQQKGQLSTTLRVGHGPNLGSRSGVGSPTPGSPTPPTFSPGTLFEPIGTVIVRTDDRTLVTSSVSCGPLPRLGAFETDRAIELTLTQPTIAGLTCARTGPVYTILSAPLGARQVIDEKTLRPLRVVRESGLPSVSVVPDGFRSSSISPTSLLPDFRGHPYVVTRFYEPSQSQTTTAGLAVSVSPSATLPSLTASGSHSEGTVAVNGHTAHVQTIDLNGTPYIRYIDWTATGFSYLVGSIAQSAHQPLSAEQLLSVARGITPPTPH